MALAADRNRKFRLPSGTCLAFGPMGPGGRKPVSELTLAMKILVSPESAEEISPCP